MIHLRSVALRPYSANASADVEYPFSVPVVASLARAPMTLDHPVTFLVGENGAGKSAILEGVACAAGSIAIAGEDVQRDPTLLAARKLGRQLRLSWSARTRQGFFLRAEDFFGYAKYITALKNDLQRDLEAFEATPGADSYGGRMARGVYLREIGELRRTDQTVNATSHGESFLELFQRRMKPGGLYVLDEPEAPLSPVRQLALLAIMRDMVEENDCQFLIATHSPILMAYPNATIYLIEEGVLRSVAWDDLEHVRVTRDFLNDPSAFLRYLSLG
jgi:predicted ATPase